MEIWSCDLFTNRLTHTFICIVSCSTSFPKGFKVLYDFTLFYVFPTNKQTNKTRTEHKTERRKKPGPRMLGGESSYIEKHKCKHDGCICVGKSTLSFFVTKT